MKKALRQLKRLTASFLCLLMVVGVLDFSVFAKDNTEDPGGDPPIQYIEEDPPIQYTEEDSTFVLARSNVDIFDEDYFPATADLQEAEAYADSQAATAQPRDDQVRMVQIWLNQNYKSVFEAHDFTVSEDGITGGNTVKGLLYALQYELKVEVDGAWGNDTAAAYEQQILSYGSKNSLVPILQCALWCKGYSPGYDNVHVVDGIVSYDDDFDEDIEAAIIRLKTDAYGSAAQNGTVTVNVMKALMSMDSFQRINGGDETVREFQQYLNRTYEDYAGLSPCDGVYGANTNRALIRSLQKEVGLPLDKTDGIFGTDTRDVCPEIPYSKNSSAARKFSDDPNVKGPYYTSDEIGRFTKLLQFALYVNGSNNIVFDGVFGSSTSQAIQSFQKDYSLSITGTANPTTWMSLLSSNGDPDRSALGLDCATILDDDKVKALYNRGYRYVGRYLTGTYDGGKSKALTVEEANAILNNGMRFFPIYQTSANRPEYFIVGKGTSDAKAAIEAAMALGIPKDTIIYFAVDFDTMDYQVTDLILPYFQEVHEVMSESIYRTGIYGTRNTCSRVAEAGYTCSSFVGDMSSGFSGNLGYKIPEDWAFDQFFTVKNDTSLGFEIDKDAVSGRDQGVSYLDTVKEDPSEQYTIDYGEPLSGTVEAPIIEFLNTSFPLFSFDVGINLNNLSGVHYQSKYNGKTDEFKVIIGLNLSGSSTTEKFDKVYSEVKQTYSSLGKNTQQFTYFQKKYKDSLIPSGVEFGINCNTNFFGFYTLKASTGKFVEGGAALVAEAKYSQSYPFLNVPFLFFKWEAKASFNTGIEFEMVDTNIQTRLDSQFTAGLSAGFEGNIIVARAYAGVTGGLEFDLHYPASTFREAAEIHLKASLFLEWNALLWGDRYEKTFADFVIYPPGTQTTSLSISPNDMKFIEPLPQIALTSTPAPGVFRQNMQVYCLPQIISLGNGKMLMTYIEDEGDTTKRISQNRTKLMYSIYDGSLWSEPQPVLDDGTVDFEPVIAPDGNGGAHILWQNGTTTFGSDVTLDEMTAGIDLYYTHWNGNAFDNTTAIVSTNQNL